MKRRFLTFLLLPVFLISCSDNPVVNPPDATHAALQSMVDSLTNYYRTEKNITQGGFFLKISSSSKDYLVSNGINIPVTSNTHFRIASVTKTFTAAAIMLLHQQGKINIYDVITDNIPGSGTPYIPDIPAYNVPYKNQITIELLLQHRAGVFDVTNQIIPNNVPQPYAGEFYIEYVRGLPGNSYHTFTFEEMVGVAAENNLSNYPPNPGQYHYSNTGYNILGKIIERVSGTSYSNFLEENFFLPLQMNNSSSVWRGDDIHIPDPKIQSFLYEGGTVKNTTEDNMSPNVSEGNIISTPGDVTRWIKLLLTGNAGVNMANVDLMKQVIPTGQGPGEYGLGISYMAGLGFGHNGAHESYLTITAYNPDNGITILIGCNFWNFPDIFEQLEHMMNLGLSAVAEME
jgi:D-alanyl-D-alanine carboxypeptidase